MPCHRTVASATVASGRTAYTDLFFELSPFVSAQWPQPPRAMRDQAATAAITVRGPATPEAPTPAAPAAATAGASGACPMERTYAAAVAAAAAAVGAKPANAGLANAGAADAAATPKNAAGTARAAAAAAGAAAISNCQAACPPGRQRTGIIPSAFAAASPASMPPEAGPSGPTAVMPSAFASALASAKEARLPQLHRPHLATPTAPRAGDATAAAAAPASAAEDGDTDVAKCLGSAFDARAAHDGSSTVALNGGEVHLACRAGADGADAHATDGAVVAAPGVALGPTLAEWEIDPRELSYGPRVGVGSYGEVRASSLVFVLVFGVDIGVCPRL